MCRASSRSTRREERGQRFGKNAGVARKTKDAEPGEGVNALVVTKIEKSPAYRLLFGNVRRHREPVTLDQHCKIRPCRSSSYPCSSSALRTSGSRSVFAKPVSIVPAPSSTSSARVQIGIARNRASETLVELRPGPLPRIVGPMRFHKRAAKKFLVFVRPDLHRNHSISEYRKATIRRAVEGPHTYDRDP